MGDKPRLAPDAVVDLPALLRGQADEWRSFMQGYGPWVRRAIQRSIQGAGLEVDDLVQEVLVRLCREDFRLLRGFDPARSSLRTWLALVARSTALDALRRVNVRRTAEQGLAALGRDEVPASREGTLPIPAGVLSARQWLVMRLLYERELTVREVARILRVDEQTVRSTRHKALARLRPVFQHPHGN